jgi:hypothetical protein
MKLRRSLVLLAGGAVAAAALSACENQYVYRPAVNTSATIQGQPASYYRIPANAPHGDVRIATFGLAQIQPREGGGELEAIHVRMIVSNTDGDRPWTVDTREQLVALPNHGESRPAYATVDQGAAPLVEIPPRQARTIDLFYPLPADMSDADDLPSFDTIWTVQTAQGPVAERTPFERLTVEPRTETSYAFSYGYAPSYWYDPYYYPGGAFVGVTVAPRFVHRPVIIVPRHRHYAPPARRVR